MFIFTRSVTHINYIKHIIMFIFTRSVTHINYIKQIIMFIFTRSVTHLNYIKQIIMFIFTRSVTYINYIKQIIMFIFIDIRYSVSDSLDIHLFIYVTWFQKNSFLYSNMIKLAPPYLCELINKKESQVNTRLGTDHHQLIMPPISKDCSITFHERSFIYAAPCEWNKLSEHIRTSNFQCFRKSVKTMLFTQQYGC